MRALVASLLLTLIAGAPAFAAKPSGGAPPASRSGWKYSNGVSAMGDKQERACIVSTNTIKLDFPYSPTPVMLCIARTSRAGEEGQLEVSAKLVGSGQILADRGARLRFDETDPMTVGGKGASDGSSEQAWFDHEVWIVRMLRSSSHVAIELTYFQAGTQVALFDAKGLQFLNPGLTAPERRKRDKALAQANSDVERKAIADHYQCLSEDREECPDIVSSKH